MRRMMKRPLNENRGAVVRVSSWHRLFEDDDEYENDCGWRRLRDDALHVYQSRDLLNRSPYAQIGLPPHRAT